jgi:tRNA A37 threonylcarbamoyladenosine dehydratase
MIPSSKEVFNRAELLLGADVMQRLASVRVIVFGVGGVGSWCAEGLVRSGVTHLTLVDADSVAPSNINRQRMATVPTVGRPKVEALKEMLLEINPEASIETFQERFTEASADAFALDTYDYIIDAIDSLKDKAALILHAAARAATFFSSMGAACKIDPSKVRVGSFWEVRGCPLGAMLRKKLRKAGTLPAKDFLCVYDEELLPNRGTETALPEQLKFDKVSHNGSLVTVTATFGFTLSGLVIQDVYASVLQEGQTPLTR